MRPPLASIAATILRSSPVDRANRSRWGEGEHVDDVNSRRRIVVAREKAVRVIEELRGLRLTTAAERVAATVEEMLAYWPIRPSRRSIGGAS